MKTFEFENGDEVVGSINNVEGYFVGGIPKRSRDMPTDMDCYIQLKDKGNVICFYSHLLSKPETPEEKEQRERLEAAYDLYTSCAHAGGCTSYEIFVSDPVMLKFWLSVVDKTKYRKGE